VDFICFFCVVAVLRRYFVSSWLTLTFCRLFSNVVVVVIVRVRERVFFSPVPENAVFLHCSRFFSSCSSFFCFLRPFAGSWGERERSRQKNRERWNVTYDHAREEREREQVLQGVHRDTEKGFTYKCHCLASLCMYPVARLAFFLFLDSKERSFFESDKEFPMSNFFFLALFLSCVGSFLLLLLLLLLFSFTWRSSKDIFFLNCVCVRVLLKSVVGMEGLLVYARATP